MHSGWARLCTLMLDPTTMEKDGMDEKLKPHHLTVSSGASGASGAPSVSFLRLRGRWLERAGFAIGASVRVLVTKGRLVLEVFDGTAEMAAQVNAEMDEALNVREATERDALRVLPHVPSLCVAEPGAPDSSDRAPL